MDAGAMPLSEESERSERKESSGLFVQCDGLR
jgi:hypothetical protein